MSVFLSRFLWLTFAVVYTFGHLIGLLFLAGAGEGTFILAGTLLTWPLLFVCLVLLSRFERKDVPATFVLLMLIHYGVSILLGVLIEFSWDWYYTKRYVEYNPGVLTCVFLWYLTGQLVLWLAYSRNLRTIKTAKLP
jgi:hypothetical protein